jgi:hypothetical protein
VKRSAALADSSKDYTAFADPKALARASRHAHKQPEQLRNSKQSKRSRAPAHTVGDLPGMEY